MPPVFAAVKIFFQSKVPFPTGVIFFVSADQPCTCMEIKRPGYFVRYSPASNPWAMVETWHWNLTSFGSCSQNNTSLVRLPSTIEHSNYLLSRHCDFPVTAV